MLLAAGKAACRRPRLKVAAFAFAWAGLLLRMPCARGDAEVTRQALARMEETLAMRFEDAGLVAQELTPAIVVSVTPAWEDSRTWYPNAALAALARVFQGASLRACEACMSPRTYVQQGRIEQVSTAPGLDEIVRLDEGSRGQAAAARTAVWLDENPHGVSLKMVDLTNGRIVLAANFDPMMVEKARSQQSFTMARELDRRTRGDSITHTFLDAAIYPQQHLSLDWMEQWGTRNTNLSGFTLSLFDPVLGLGGAYHRIVPDAMNISVGAKVLMAFPTALVRAVGGEDDVVDPLLTGVFIARIPFGRSNYGAVFSASTNGRIGIGISLMNTTLLPFVP